MKIEHLTSEEKQQLFDSLLEERLKEQPESVSELIAKIQNFGTSSINEDIDDWANSSNI